MTKVPVLDEKVPIPVDMLPELRQTIFNASRAAEDLARLGIAVAQIIARAGKAAQEADESKQAAETSIRQLLATVNVNPSEYRSIDPEEGVIIIQRPPVEV